jgi:hypothetical protein
MTLEEFYRIVDAIEPDEYGCWNLPGRFPGRYHLVHVDGKRIRATRLVLARKLGRPIKAGFHALHTCDWPSCVNPDHLYEGTDKDNIRDAMERYPEYEEEKRKRNSSPENVERLRRWSKAAAKARWDKYRNNE